MLFRLFLIIFWLNSIELQYRPKHENKRFIGNQKYKYWCISKTNITDSSDSTF